MLRRILSAVFVIVTVASCALLQPVQEIGSRASASVEYLSDGKAKYVDVLAFNDYHGTVYEDKLGKNVGMAKMASIVKRFKDLNPNTIIVSAGDNYQGSALSVVTKGQVVSDFLRSIEVAASAVGNHEFDWGDGHFDEWGRAGGFPFLAANIVDKRTGDIPAWAKPYVVYKVGGRTIAFIGLSTLETPSSVAARNIADYEFTETSVAALKWSNYLRTTYKPDVIIGLTHIPSAVDGLDRSRAVTAGEDGELERLAKRGGLDAIITGHSHNSVNAKTHGVPVLQASYYGRAFGRIRLAFKEGGGVSISTSLVEFWQEKAELPADAEIAGMIDSYMAEHGQGFLERVAVVEGELAHDRLLTPNVTPMGAWVCSVLRERYGADVAIMNGGGLRKPFLAGPVAVQDFWDLMPFDNTAVVFEATGADLRKMVDHGIDSLDFMNGQFAGLVVKYNPSRPYGRKIISMSLLDGTVIEDDRLYTVVTNDFIFEGGDAYDMMESAGKNVLYTYEPIRDVLIDEARKAGVLAAVVPDSLVVTSE